MKRIHAIVFDLDGTLVDTFADLTTAVNIMRRRRGMPALDVPEVKTHVGRGAHQLLAGTLGEMDPVAWAAAMAEFMAVYTGHVLDETRPYPGVLEGLSTLREAGFAMAVLSNKPVLHTRAIVGGLGLAPFFAAVYGGDSFPAMKPDPRPLLATVAALGAASADSLMVGDSWLDVSAARAAGMRVALVSWGLSGPEEIATLAPDMVTYDLRDLSSEVEPLSPRGSAG